MTTTLTPISPVTFAFSGNRTKTKHASDIIRELTEYSNTLVASVLSQKIAVQSAIESSKLMTWNIIDPSKTVRGDRCVALLLEYLDSRVAMTESLLRAGLTVFDSTCTKISASALLRAVYLADRKIVTDNLRLTVKDIFSSIEQAVGNSKGELAPQLWDAELVNDFSCASSALHDDDRGGILPVALKVATGCQDEVFNKYDGHPRYFPSYKVLSTFKGEDLNQILEAVPAVAMLLEAPWSKCSDNDSGGKLTENIARQSLERLSNCKEDSVGAHCRTKLLNKCDLSWMTYQEANEQIKNDFFSLDRFVRFKDASAEQFSLMLEKTLNGNSTELLGGKSFISDLPGFSKYASDVESVRPAFQNSFLSRNCIDARLIVLRTIADAQKTLDIGQGLLHEAVRVAFEDIKKCGNPYMEAHLCIEVAAAVLGTKILFSSIPGFKVCADPEFLASYIMKLRMGLNVLDSGGHSQDKRARNILEAVGATPKSQEIIRAALIESGITNLGALRSKDLTKPLLESTLTKHPKRLAEVERIGDFIRLSKMFNIPVNVPPEILNAESISNTMNDAIAAADPLAGADPLASVDTPAPKRRKARA